MKRTLILSLFCFPLTLFAQSVPDSYRVMSYNIRYENAGDTGVISWKERKSQVVSNIQFHKADIIGMQEVLHSQLAYLVVKLSGFQYAGFGREDGKEKGEYAPVFYNTKLFEKIADSSFWLSPTPAKVSIGWDAALERICTWVALRDKKTKKIFFVFNTHFDHMGLNAREQSARLLLQQIKKIAGSNAVILTGDFNADENSAPIKVLKTNYGDKKVLLFETSSVSALPHHGPDKTFCGFKPNHEIIGNRIDYIFVTKSFKVLSHATLTDFKGPYFPSDHLPVFSEIVLN